MIPVTVRSRHGEPAISTHVGSVAASTAHALHVLTFDCPLCTHPIELQAVQHGFVASNLTPGELERGEDVAIRIEAVLMVEPAPLWRHLGQVHGIGWAP